MILHKTILLVLCCLAISCEGQLVLQSHKEVLKLMGTRFELTAMADSKENAIAAVKEGIKEIQRIEAMISSWKADSQTSAINKNAGIQPVKVDQELFDLTHRSLKVSKLTEGAFDISFASMSNLYTFDKKERSLPSEQERLKAIQLIDYSLIQLDEDNNSIFLPKEGMKIGFGGIGKGYAANKAKTLMSKMKGVAGGLVNASGDLIAWGKNGKEEGWPIQIADPKHPEKSLGWLNIKNRSIVTSGDYEKYFSYKGKRYAHIINPKTGLPTTGIKSVTIICPDAEVGDALATALFVMGGKNAIELVNSLKSIEALIVTDDNEVLTSNKLNLNKY